MKNSFTTTLTEAYSNSIGITGATGFIGKALQQEALQNGKKLILFSRTPEKLIKSGVQARRFTSDAVPDLNGCESIIHLAGESIVGIWTKEKRRRILESRREGTRRIVEGIAQAKVRPSVLVSASGIGYYGDRGHKVLTESSSPGDGFLAEVAQVWEEEALQAELYGVRVVLIRTGLVLGRSGGMLPKIALLFRLGLGGILGSGNQEMSCIHVHDLVRLMLRSCDDPAFQGPFNAVMPHPVTNRAFTKGLGHAVHRPTFLRTPAFLLRSMLGDLSHLLLDSQHALPKKALQLGFQFHYPTVEKAFQEIL
jgi:uncharacterized protein (TIGR01777 family)